MRVGVPYPSLEPPFSPSDPQPLSFFDDSTLCYLLHFAFSLGRETTSPPLSSLLDRRSSTFSQAIFFPTFFFLLFSKPDPFFFTTPFYKFLLFYLSFPSFFFLLISFSRNSWGQKHLAFLSFLTFWTLGGTEKKPSESACPVIQLQHRLECQVLCVVYSSHANYYPTLYPSFFPPFPFYVVAFGSRSRTLQPTARKTHSH